MNLKESFLSSTYHGYEILSIHNIGNNFVSFIHQAADENNTLPCILCES